MKEIIPKKISTYLFLSPLTSKEGVDNNLYSKFNFIRNKKIIKKCEEQKNVKIRNNG